MFEKIDPIHINESMIKRIGIDSMLITAGDSNDYNTMTAAWGSVGYLWGRPVAQIFVRPGRYTFQFIESKDYFTLCFFPPQMKAVLNFCGTNSGCNVDKVKVCELTAVETEKDQIYFEEAEHVLICKKLYKDVLKLENISDPEIVKLFYPKGEAHHMYIGEIVQYLRKIN